MVRIGFAGAGFIAGVHAEILARLPDVQVAAVGDPSLEHVQKFTEKTGARALPSFEALLEESDAIYVCAPNFFHAELSVRALAAGVHVFCEKPLATSVEDAHRVQEAAAQAKGVYQTGFNQRCAPVFQALRGRIDAGELTPRWGHLKMNRGELQRPAWVADSAVTGGFLYETPIHVLDLACWLFGPAQEVVCRATESCSSQLDDFAMLLTFASGVTATLCSSAHTTWIHPYERLEIYGVHQAAVTEDADRIVFQLGLDVEPFTEDVSQLPWEERWGYAAEDEAFIAAVRGEAPPPAGAGDGVRAVELIDACYRAAQSGEAVRLSSGSAHALES